MTIYTARLIRELKKRCTYRRLAEIYYSPQQRGHGVQDAGIELCKLACEKLGIDFYHPEKYDGDEEFKRDNRSYIGEYYWYE